MEFISTNINGYIEGYYGRLLNWSERNQILKKLNSCNFNTYFYCPKEDLCHRLYWRRNYNKSWITAFKNFCKNSQKLKINIMIGISPGLDFNFTENSSDFKILVKKAKMLKSFGAVYIGLLFDDIPSQSHKVDAQKKTDGVLHAELTNYLSKKIDAQIFVVPRVYSDELIESKNNYLFDFGKTIYKGIPIFYCGKNIISETNHNDELKTIKKNVTNKIIFWDNLYANDYCPKKIFIGPYMGRSSFHNTMINPTGLIKTDLLILDLINYSIKQNSSDKGWKYILKEYKIPEQFQLVSQYFFPLNYKQKNISKKITYEKHMEALDFLLWKWKNSLSREWYQYMLILKQDLQLLNGELKPGRVKKVFPAPLKEFLFTTKRRGK